MNSRTAVGYKALMLKEDHGLALGVREMSVFKRNPQNYISMYRKSKLKLTRDVVLGQAFHRLLLQGPAGINVNCCLADTCEDKPLTKFSAGEISCVNLVDMWRLEQMLRNFRENVAVRRLFNNTLIYKVCSGLFIENNSGCECFFSADFILPEKGCVIDVKTCRETSRDAIDLEIKRLQYHWQAWWAKTGASLCFEMPLKDFVFIFVGQNAPFEVVVHYAPAEMFCQAQAELLPFINMYDHFFEAGRFSRMLVC